MIVFPCCVVARKDDDDSAVVFSSAEQHIHLKHGKKKTRHEFPWVAEKLSNKTVKDALQQHTE